MKKAFTLAEVLITLGIIGVVAAMTLPTLIQQHQKQVYVNGIKKGISVASNMLAKIQADEGVSSLASTSIFTDGLCSVNYDFSTGTNRNGCEDFYGNPSVFERIVPKYLKVVKTCVDDSCDIVYDYWGQFSSNGKYSLSSSDHGQLSSASSVTWNQKLYGFYTSDGMIFYFIPARNAIKIAVDTNGIKGPNKHGRDLFYLAYCADKDGKMMPSSPNSDYACGDELSSLKNYSPLYHLMQNGWKMDY